jgi:hypothetical protein
MPNADSRSSVAIARTSNQRAVTKRIPHAGDGPEAVDEERIEDAVGEVRQPQRLHRQHRVAGAAEDRVLHEQQHHDHLGAEDQRRVPGADRDHLGRPAHLHQQPGREQRARQAEDQAQDPHEADRLRTGPGGAFEVAFADAPRHHGCRRHRQAEPDRVDDGEHRLGQADGGHRGLVAEPGDEEDVDDGEGRLHRHLEHHRDREQPGGPRQAALRVVELGAGEDGAQGRQEPLRVDAAGGRGGIGGSGGQGTRRRWRTTRSAPRGGRGTLQWRAARAIEPATPPVRARTRRRP